MSIGSLPQRMVERLLGRREPAVTPDDPVARMIARTSRRIRPARSYRWRLRGRLVNQYVAAREGLMPFPPPQRARMGSLGRAVLFASVGLALSVSAVGAASTSALPGDPLYAVKREVEELRMEIAPPSVRPALAAAALEARLSEVELLAAAGNWARVALGEQEVDAAVATLQELGGSLTPDQVIGLERHTQVLTALLAGAPAAAQPGLERALLASAGVTTASNSGKHLGQGGTTGSSGTASNGNHVTANNGNGGNNSSGASTAGGTATSASPSPTGAPKSPTPPHGSPAPHESPQPSGAEATQPAH